MIDIAIHRHVPPAQQAQVKANLHARGIVVSHIGHRVQRDTSRERHTQTLIKHEKIIYDSEEMQFIAVTTKDGNVFYILINYSAEGDEDNVFFLNKVDDFDLYSLLYAGNEGEEEKDPAEQAKKYADAATNGGVTADVSDRAEEATGETNSAEEKSTTKQPSSMNSNALILVGVGVLAVIGGAVLVLKKGKFGKKKNTGVEDFEEDYDDDYGSVTDEDDEA